MRVFDKKNKYVLFLSTFICSTEAKGLHSDCPSFFTTEAFVSPIVQEVPMVLLTLCQQRWCVVSFGFQSPQSDGRAGAMKDSKVHKAVLPI